jgi:hypothetical protein
MKKNENEQKVIDFLNTLSIEQLRGSIIEQLYEIEQILDKLILDHFKPEEDIEFNEILLNSSILDFGKKIKI